VQLAGQTFNDQAERQVKTAFVKADKLEPQSLAIQIGKGQVSAVFTKIEVTESSNASADAAMAANDAPPDASMAYREVQYHMRHPHLMYACCTCPHAAQQQLCKHQSAVLMQLYPGPEAWKVMVLMLGTRLGMLGGCYPEHKEPLRPLHNRLLRLALPALRNAELPCHVNHAIANGSDASAIGCCTSPPPTPHAAHSHAQQYTTRPSSPQQAADRPSFLQTEGLTAAKVDSATSSLLHECAQLLQSVKHQQDGAKQKALLQQATAMVAHWKRSQSAMEAAECDVQLHQHAGMSAKRHLDAMEANRLRKRAKSVPAGSTFQLPERTAREGTSYAWQQSQSAAEMIDKLYSKAPCSKDMS
jgi:hypothetical protein